MIFKPLVGQTMEVYIDDTITKSKNADEHVKYLEETFTLMIEYQMNLNPKKYILG